MKEWCCFRFSFLFVAVVLFSLVLVFFVCFGWRGEGRGGLSFADELLFLLYFTFIILRSMKCIFIFLIFGEV